MKKEKIYTLIFLLILFLPIENFKSKKDKIIITNIMLLIIISVLGNLAFVSKDLLNAYPKI